MLDGIDGGEFFPDEGTASFLRLMRRGWWYFAPYGFWTEPGGEYVVFDRGYHPICRVHQGGHVEIVPPNEFIPYVEQRWLYRDWTCPHLSAETRDKITKLVQRLGLSQEIIRRRHVRPLPRAPWELVRAHLRGRGRRTVRRYA